MRKDGGPAFPSQNDIEYFHGMTLRDHFAGQALIGIMQGSLFDHLVAITENNEDFGKNIAKAAYEFADAMIAAREANQ